MPESWGRKSAKCLDPCPQPPWAISTALQYVACTHQKKEIQKRRKEGTKEEEEEEKEIDKEVPNRMQNSAFLNSSSASNIITTLWRCFGRGVWEGRFISKATSLMWLIKVLWAQERCLREWLSLWGQVWTPVADSLTQGWHTSLEEQAIANGNYFKPPAPRRHLLRVCGWP